MPTLADIYSAADSFKRRLTDVVSNPLTSAQQMLGYANDRARGLRQDIGQSAQQSMQTGEFITPQDKVMAAQLAEAYNPVGMVSFARGEKPIQSAVVKIGDKLFMGRTHGDALNRAIYEGVVRKEGGKYIYPKDQDLNMDLFLTKEGNLIDRWGAYFDHDIGASETAIEKGLMQNNPSWSATLDEFSKRNQTQKPQEYGYRGEHKAPGPDFGAPLHDLTGGGQMYPSDVYSASASRIYGTGYPQADREAFDLAKRVRGNPNAQVTMYRAVPKDESIKSINPGDWVSLSKSYAQNHGESVLGKDYKIISQKVKAKDLWTNADSIHEFGYHPSND